jgi:hypothetical protein
MWTLVLLVGVVACVSPATRTYKPPVDFDALRQIDGLWSAVVSQLGG